MKYLLLALFSKKDKISSIDRYLESNNLISTMTLLIESEDGKILLEKNKGTLDKEKPFLLASISKLYTYSIIFSLIDEGKLSYDDTVAEVLNDIDLRELHTLHDTDYSSKITVRHLLDQNTGLPDYETDKQPNGATVFNDIIEKDLTIDFDTSIRITKSLKPKFPPGVEHRAYYANANANILARISEAVTGQSYLELLSERIIIPLKLVRTYACKPDTKHEPIYIGSRAVIRPKYLASSVESGGIIASNTELMVFIRAFFEGKLFNIKHLEHPKFRRIQFFPIKYGSGMMQVRMPRAMSPFIPAPAILGHSGSSGSFAFYCPDKKVYITGTINQIKSRPFPLLYMYLNTI